MSNRTKLIYGILIFLVSLIAAALITYYLLPFMPRWNLKSMDLVLWLLASHLLVCMIGTLLAYGLGRVSRLKMMKVGCLVVAAVFVAVYLGYSNSLPFRLVGLNVITLIMLFFMIKYMSQPETRSLGILIDIGYVAVLFVYVPYHGVVWQLVSKYLILLMACWSLVFLGGIANGRYLRQRDRILV